MMKRYAIDLVILIFPFLVALALYPLLPATIPLQFHLDGSVSRYGDKSQVFFIALLPFIIYEYSKFKRSR